MVTQLFNLFKRNFGYLAVSDDTAMELLSDKGNKVFARYDRSNNLIAASVVHNNTILMLAVDKEYRGHGIGTALLEMSEEYIKSKGYDHVVFGVGLMSYFAPGVPTSTMLVEMPESPELWEGLEAYPAEFVKRRGYNHASGCNIFDMDMPLTDATEFPVHHGETKDGVTYRFASIEDKEGIMACCKAGADYFAGYYQDDNFYTTDSDERVLVADIDGDIVGCLLVMTYSETGEIGCVTVAPKARGKKIGTNMSIAATSYIKDKGCSRAFLSYTYSGLDKMYGKAGYKICAYYYMAKKEFQARS